MNLLNVISSVAAVFEQGKAIKGATFLTNAEATAAFIYGLLSTLVVVLNAFGVVIDVDGVDLHSVANGWSATISLIYAAYRAATNPVVGVKPK